MAEINNEHLKKIAADLVAAINGQDNRMTATPYYYVIRTQETAFSETENGLQYLGGGCGDDDLKK